MNSLSDRRLGIIYTFSAFSIWGFLTVYWKWLAAIPSWVVLAHRILWAFVFMLLVIALRGQFRGLCMKTVWLIHQPKQLLVVFAGSLAISANWMLYVWAVGHQHVLDASLGLFMIPLVSMLIGILFFKERSDAWGWLSLALAFTGVLLVTVHFGVVPWLALSLAATSGMYSFCKKIIQLDALIGMSIETLLIIPIAVVVLTVHTYATPGLQTAFSGTTALLLIGAGILTALPLIWFAEGAKRIPLTMIGFFQYMTPSSAFLIGVFLFHESMDRIQFLSFLFIWCAICIYAWREVSRNAAGKRSAHASL
ncbi:RarD protein, DMT superfamily transporter [Sporolactobacillus inulinus]|uniref:RarD protein, DMT superfamily transporter n=1 Tax=Sporolactobacillus inulinus TaxID=2078 RepID=A0A4Y1ZER3_9BACL|nr:RarD protein, DMT superfamily transporter [Sporolactobacillus inulinus]